MQYYFAKETASFRPPHIDAIDYRCDINLQKQTDPIVFCIAKFFRAPSNVASEIEPAYYDWDVVGSERGSSSTK